MKKQALLAAFVFLFVALNAQAASKPMTTSSYILCYLPLGLFMIITIALYRWAKRDKVNLNDLLSEKNPPAGTQVPVQPGAALPQSSSRLVMLMAGIAAVIVGISFTCYDLYAQQYYGKATDWSALTAALLSLGIGVVPYAVKQVFKS